MKIVVTQEDIDRGVKFDCYHCPIALAVKRTSKSTDVSVAEIGPTVSIVEGEIEKIYDMPPRAEKFVDKFDAGKKVEPFSFSMHEKKGPEK